MSLNPEQLILQLGVAGALLFVVYKLTTLAIERWGKIEDAKTAAIAEGFKSITSSINTHHQADIRSHQEMATGIAEIKGMLTERSGVHEMPQPPRTRTPAHGIREISRARSQGDR